MDSQIKQQFIATALILLTSLAIPVSAQELLHQMAERSEAYAIAGRELDRAEAPAVPYQITGSVNIENGIITMPFKKKVA